MLSGIKLSIKLEEIQYNEESQETSKLCFINHIMISEGLCNSESGFERNGFKIKPTQSNMDYLNNKPEKTFKILFILYELSA